MRLGNLKIGTKLRLTIGTFMTLLTIVAFFGYYGIVLYSGYTDDIQHAQLAEKSFINARFSVQNMTNSKNDSDYQQSKAYIDTCITDIKTLIENLSDTQKIKELNELINNFEEYGRETDSLFAVINSETEMLAQTIAIGEKMMHLVAQHHGTTSEIYGQLMRGYVNFLLFLYAGEDRFYENSQHFFSLVYEEANSEVTPLVKDFSESFTKYGDVVKLVEEKTTTQGAFGEKVMEQIKYQTNETMLTRELNESRTHISIIIVYVIACVLAFTISYVITRHIQLGIKNGVFLAELYASGDLTFIIPEEQLIRKDEFGDLARAMSDMGNKMKAVLADVSKGAENVSVASNQMSGMSQQMSQGSNEQASSTEEISSSMEQMAANIEHNTDNAQQAEKLSEVVSNGIGEVSIAASKSIDSIRNIASKITIISDIAAQTNILALNAAIEAARAGEHGKGFAVVAAEVRKLAERSKLSADEIIGLATEGVEVAEGSGKLLNTLINEIEKTVQMVREIAASSIEQRGGAEQVNNAIQQLNQVVQHNAASSEEMATNAEELANQAEQLKDAISFFRIDNSKEKNRQTSKIVKQVNKTDKTYNKYQASKVEKTSPIIVKTDKASLTTKADRTGQTIKTNKTSQTYKTNKTDKKSLIDDIEELKIDDFEIPKPKTKSSTKGIDFDIYKSLESDSDFEKF